MTRTLAVAVAVATLCTGSLFLAWTAHDARAQDPIDRLEPADEPAQVVPPAPPRMLCQLFHIDLDHNAVLETSDRTSEIGQWVGEREDDGWILRDVDFEVGQKHTGFPQGYAYVCMESRP